MKISPIILTAEQMSRLQELSQILTIYINILGLEKEKIEIGISSKDTAFLHWYENKSVWGIYILPTDNDFTPIHELGHIFLAKKTNYPYFAKSGIPNIKVFEGVKLIINHLIDCFVDFNLIQFEKLYELYIEDAHLWRPAKKRGKIKGEPIDKVHCYKTLLGCYLSLKLINKEKDHHNFVLLKNYLKKAKYFMSKSFPHHHFNFQSLEKKLDQFNEIKNTNDAKSIINFICDILLEIDLWDRKDILEQIKFLFPSK